MRESKVNCWTPVFDNDNDALIPEVWAAESLMILEANMVAAHLVHRDFEDEIAQFGDTVNTRRPADFKAVRKTDADQVTVQDAISTNVPVKLNQHFHTSFIIKDGEESKSFLSLVNYYLRPALISIAQGVDEVILCQGYDFMSYSVGKLGTDPTKATVIAAKEVLNTNKAPMADRNFVVSPNAEGALLEIGEFTKANEVGDDGSALREGHLGRKFGFNFFMDQNTPSVSSGNTIVTGAINNAAGYAAGSTVLTVDGFSAALTNGSWCTIAGDMTPQMITASVGGATPTQITVSPGLRSAVVDNAVVTVYTPGAINLGAGYASGYEKSLVVDGFTVSPQVGQLMTIGATGSEPAYGIVDSLDTAGNSIPSTTGVLPNRPLDAAVADNAVVGIGPAGEYCLGFHRNAMALVSRPLALPAEGAGARGAVVNYNDLSIRVVISYQGKDQGHLVTVDLLCGVTTLDQRLGCLMYA